MWGDLAAIAAVLHIKDDLEHMGYGWDHDIPKDREDAKQYFGDIDDFIKGD